MSNTQQDCAWSISAAESSYGTITTPTRSLEFVSGDMISWTPTFVQGAGMRSGSRGPRSARRVLGREIAGGDLSFEASSKGQGILWKAALGTSVVTQRSSTAVYQQNHTPLAADFAKSYTWQKVLPPLGGSQVAVTYPGMVCSGFELAVASGAVATIKTSWTGKKKDTATSLASLTYPAEPVELLTFADAAVSLGGGSFTGTLTAATTTATASGGQSVGNIRDITITYDNGLDDNPGTLGGAGQRTRANALGNWSLTGSMTAEYVDQNLRDALYGQNDLFLILTLTGLSTIGSGSDHPVLQVVLTDLRIEGDEPGANGGDVIAPTINFTAMDDLTDAPITVSYVSLDTAP